MLMVHCPWVYSPSGRTCSAMTWRYSCQCTCYARPPTSAHFITNYDTHVGREAGIHVPCMPGLCIQVQQVMRSYVLSGILIEQLLHNMTPNIKSIILGENHTVRVKINSYVSLTKQVSTMLWSQCEVKVLDRQFLPSASRSCQFTPRKYSLQYQLNWRLGGPQSRFRCYVEEKYHSPLPGIEPLLFRH
jgi:hypothetical protein